MTETRGPGAVFQAASAPLIVPCKHCNGSGTVQDVSNWPPVSPCPGCKGAGQHVLGASPE